MTAGLYWLPAERSHSPRPASCGSATISIGWLTEHPQVYGVVLPLVFDIDRARDIEAAELAGLGREREDFRA